MTEKLKKSMQGSAQALPAPAVRHRGPSLQKTELTRSEILRAAHAEFMEVGIAKATMDRIAKRAKLAKGTLYLYFASKEALLQGAVEATISHTALMTSKNPRKHGETVRNYITRLVIPTVENYRSSGRADLARFILGDARNQPSLAQFYRDNVFCPWLKQFEALFELAAAEGELKGVSPVTAAHLLGAPFWLMLAQDALEQSPQKGCLPVEFMLAQIDVLFGRTR